MASVADRNIAWIEAHCLVPDGRDIGKPVVLREWQRVELRKIYDNPAGTRQAIISFPRKNGKTALISFLLLLHLCGPEAKRNSQLVSTGMARDQAAVIFNLASRIVRQSPLLHEYIVVRDTKKELACPELGTIYTALSADSATAHGKSVIFAVHDELGQVRGPVSALYDAIETSMGAHESPLSIIISTQAPTSNDLLSRLIDEAEKGSDPQTVVSVYAADVDDDPFSEATLKACNPAWGDFLNANEVLRTMRTAKLLPSQESAYRNLHLNQRVDVHSPFVSQSSWMLGRGTPLDDWQGRTVFGGIDLAKAASDMTALVMVTDQGDKWHVRAHYWMPEKGLEERARLDGEPYDVWRDAGWLETTPGSAVDYDHVAIRIAEILDEVNAIELGYDPYNWSHMRPALIRAGVAPEQMPDAGEKHAGHQFRPFRQGMITMSPAIANLEAAILDEKLVHYHPILDMNAKNAVTERDRAGNRMLAKHKSRGRIDGLVALAMSMSVAATWAELEVREPEYEMLIL